MAEEEQREEVPQEEGGEQEPPVLGGEGAKDVAKSGAFGGIKREISDEDLKNPAVGRMLLDERDRLLQRIAGLEAYRENYHKADKRAEVCEAVEGTAQGRKLIHAVTQTGGGALIGAAASFSGQDLFWLLFIVGLLFVLGSVALSFKK